MSVSVIIPAHNEQEWLNRTIENIFATAHSCIEVVIILNGYEQEVDYPLNDKVKIVQLEHNEGERVAMNRGVEVATGTHILRIDAHCDFTPNGWDVMMEKVTDDKTITVAVLTALKISWEHLDKKRKEGWLRSGHKQEDWHEWEREKGHWYGFARLLPTMEAKWEKPNRDHSTYKTVEPNMAFTGCGFMLTKKFYEEIGGADESLPMMGAIGEEFAVKAWVHGGKVQTRTDVMIGHIFGTGGYNTQGVLDARRALETQYCDHYQMIADKFPNIVKLKTAEQRRTVTVNREDTETIKDSDGKTIKQIIKRYRYVWIDDGSGLTDAEVCEKYAPIATYIGVQVLIADDDGNMIKESKK